MRKSDIFEDFARIALEKGLIKKASPEDLQKKLEQNPRWDSLDISAIEALYGVKPDMPKDMKYERNIIDDAHPNAVVIAPSYDKLNGLVENVNERQDIILNILKKNPDGLLTQHKYAQQNLILSLVRIGNYLDNNKKDELRILADTCLKQASDEIKKKDQLIKEAFDPLTWAIIGSVAALLVGTYIQQHINDFDAGYIENYKTLSEAIDDMLNNSVSWGFGEQYSQYFINLLKKFKEQIDNYNNLYLKHKQTIFDIETPKTVSELRSVDTQKQLADVQNAYKELHAASTNMSSFLIKMKNDLNSVNWQNKQIEDKGVFQKGIDWLQVFHGGKGLFRNKFEAVAQAIPVYQESIKDISDMLLAAQTHSNEQVQQIKSEIEQSSSQEQSKPTKQPDTSPEKPIQEGIEGLEQQLSSLPSEFFK
jgi:hypothetical protein